MVTVAMDPPVASTSPAATKSALTAVVGYSMANVLAPPPSSYRTTAPNLVIPAFSIAPRPVARAYADAMVGDAVTLA